MMPQENRDSGISAFGRVPWGSRLEVFYDTLDDMYDTIAGFFKAGLEKNEHCRLIIPTELKKTQAIQIFTQTIPEFPKYLEKGQIMLFSQEKNDTPCSPSDIENKYQLFYKIVNKARKNGYEGVRSVIDLSEINKNDWNKLQKYINSRKQLSSEFHFLNMGMYPLEKCGASELVQVMREYKYVLINKQGEYYSPESLKSLRDEMSSYHSIIRDLTEKLQISREEFSRAVRLSPEVIAVSRLEDGKYIEINDTFTQLFGYTRDEMIGRSSLEFNILLDKHVRELITKKIKNNGMLLNQKVVSRTKNGEMRRLLLSAETITIDDELHVVWMMTKTGSRKNTEENRRMMLHLAMDGSLTPLQKKFVDLGFQACTDRDIIELFLSLTMSHSHAHKLAKGCIAEFQTLGEFLSAPISQWQSMGIPLHSALSLALIQEIPGRILKQRMIEQPVYNSPQQIVDYLYYTMRDIKKEVLKVIHLNDRNQIKVIIDLFEGSTDRISFNLREAIEGAIAHSSKSLIFAHNHPNGDPIPSKSDKQITRDLVFIGNILQIRVIDHIVIGDNRYFSFADEGLIKEYETDFLNLRLRGTSEAKRRLETAKKLAIEKRSS